MPRRPEWVHRLNTALAQLDSIAAPTLDRRAIEVLLGVSPRQAIRILHRLCGHQAGQALVIGRDELKEKLTELSANGDVRFERSRHGRVGEELARLGSARNASRIAVDAPASSDLAQLSPNIRLGAGKLEIAFESGEDLLSLLLELAQAIAADPDHFQQRMQSAKTL